MSALLTETDWLDDYTEAETAEVHRQLDAEAAHYAQEFPLTHPPLRSLVEVEAERCHESFCSSECTQHETRIACRCHGQFDCEEV